MSACLRAVMRCGALCLAGAVAGCGQTGPLYLPAPPAAAHAAPPAAPPAAAPPGTAAPQR